MSESSVGKVINCHWVGGSDNLPPNTVYIGRPSEYGNPYSSKSGKYTKEECIALHRVELYRTLIHDPAYLFQLQTELKGRDLACWCKQPKRLVGCHGDNYLHVLSERLANRPYTKTITSYLMEDLRYVLEQFSNRIRLDLSQDTFLFLFIHFGDVRLDIQNVLLLCQTNFVNSDDLNFLISLLVVELELAYQDIDLEMITFWFSHIHWVIDRFIKNTKDRSGEPVPPHVSLKRIKKV